MREGEREPSNGDVIKKQCWIGEKQQTVFPLYAIETQLRVQNTKPPNELDISHHHHHLQSKGKLY